MRFRIQDELSFQTVRILRCNRSYHEILEIIFGGIARVNLDRRRGKCWGSVVGHEGRREKIKSWLLEFLGLV